MSLSKTSVLKVSATERVSVENSWGQRSRLTPNYPGNLSNRPVWLIKHLIVTKLFFFLFCFEMVLFLDGIPLHILCNTLLLPSIRTPHTPAVCPPDQPRPPPSTTRSLSIPVLCPDSTHCPGPVFPPGLGARSASLKHKHKIYK